MRPLAVIGNVNVDLILGPTEPWPQPGTEVIVAHDDLRVGGAAGNTALAWMALGAEFTLASSVGSDAFGKWLAETFGERSARWPVHGTRTTVSVGITHPGDERTFFTTVGHLPELTWAETVPQLDSAALRGGVLLVCGCFVMPGLSADYPALFDWAEAQGIDVALDTGWPPGGWTAQQRQQTETWVRRTTHLLVNEIEAMGLTRTDSVPAALAALADLLPDGGRAVIKAGPSGAVTTGAQGPLRVPAPEVQQVIDTIGAGDVFNAGYLLAVATGAGPRDAMQAGVTMASLAVSTSPRRYARPGPQVEAVW